MKKPSPKTQREKVERSEAEREMALINKKMGFMTLELQPRTWLDTGSKILNAVMGSEEKGIAYGKMIEISGPESHGKSLLSALLTGLAEADGAECCWVDLENSLDRRWVKGQGISWDRLYRAYPKLVQESKKSKPRLQTAEEICTEVEMWMERRHAKGVKKMFIVVDSVIAFLVEEESEAGNLDQNMRTKISLAAFLSRLLRRWCALSQVYNATIIFINQLRMNPGQRFGNPEQTSGGKALKFYCSIRVAVRRVKGGRLLQKGKMVGLRGIITNNKNKAGGGSEEGMKAGFKVRFPSDWGFLSAAKLKKDAAGGDEDGEE